MAGIESSEPTARARILVAIRAAVLDLWGDKGLLDIAARLPAETRRRSLEERMTPLAWVPERDIIAWYEALWSGPVEGREDAFLRFVRQMMDRGFGRTRRALLRIATPEALITRAPQLWRLEHSHGDISFVLARRGARLTLSDSLYATLPLLRLTTTEIYRYALSLSRAHDVTAVTHGGEEGSLVIEMSWS